MASPIDWRLATVTVIRDETPTVRSFTLAIPDWPPHRPGQHVDLRLTAQDGYSVERSYSIASEPERSGEIDITVERIQDGEASPFLHDVVVAGDRLEVRGPIGGYFVWGPAQGGPLLLVAGGSGVVPLMAMIRHRQRTGSNVPTRLLYSSRHLEDVIYRDELDRLAGEDDGHPHPHPVPTTGLVGLRTPDRRPDAGAGDRAAGDRLSGVHLRTDGTGRDGCQRARPPRPAGRPRPDRAVRTHRNVTAEEDAAMMDDKTPDPAAELVVDGNALAGVLAAAFGSDVTAVPSRCAHCGAVNVVAQLRAYVRAPGAVLRCPACEGVVVRVVETADATYVDARGAAYLRFDRG